MVIIESIADWREYAEILTDLGYGLWQTQYDIAVPEGFHAWFGNSDARQIEIVTHSKEIHDAIIKYGSR